MTHLTTRRLKPGPLLIGGVPLLLASLAVTTAIGPADVGAGEVITVLRTRLGFGGAELARVTYGIVWDLRLPRTVLAAVCGAGLAVCGAVLQSLLRNPLADPFLLGISAGASTGAVAVVILGAGLGTIGLTTGAFLGALTAFVLVVALATLAGGGTARVVLAGVAGTQLFSAITSYIVITSADAEEARGVLFWLLGSLSRARWDDVALAGAVCVFALTVCLSRASDLDAFTFGHDAAAALGVSVRQVRALLLTVTALLTAVLVAAAGAIGFVGLVVPHGARLLVGPMHRALLPVTALFGAVLLVWVDTLARTIATPLEVPVGVVTALVGVPAFAVLLGRKKVTS